MISPLPCQLWFFSSSSSHLPRSVRETPALPNQIHRGDRGGTGNPALPYKFPISMYLAAETRLWPDLGWQTIFSAETTFCRINHPQTNFSPAERHLAGEIHRGDRYGKPLVCRTGLLPHWTFTRGKVRHRKAMFFCAEPAVSVSGFRFFCHGAQAFPVGLRGAAAFCGTNRVKLRSASAPQSRYYF